MLSDLQRQKFTLRFAFYDVDGNGVLEKEDFIAYAVRQAEAFNAPPDAAAHLVQVMVDTWEQLSDAADFNHDHKITLDEWLTAFEGITSTPEGIEAWIDRWTDGAFEMYAIVDPDGPQDAQTRERFVKWAVVDGAQQAQAEEFFDAMDTNGDGLLSIEELRGFTRAWLADHPDHDQYPPAR